MGRKISLTNDDMDDDDADLLAAVESAENPPPAAVSEAPTTKGFVTATGKTVSVTESSLAMARRLWSSMSEDEMAAPEAHLKKMTELKRIALAKSSMAKASQMWQEAAEEDMSVTEAYMKRMTDSKRIPLSTNSMEKATQMWEDAAKDEEGGKGDDASNEGQRGAPTAAVEKTEELGQSLSYSGPLKLTPLAGGARTPSGSAVAAAFKPLTPVFTPTGSWSGRRKRPAALGASTVSPASASSGASPSLASIGSAKRPRLKFKAPTRITPVTTGVSSSQKENDRVVQNFDLESNQFESDICDFMDRMDEAHQGSVED